MSIVMEMSSNNEQKPNQITVANSPAMKSTESLHSTHSDESSEYVSEKTKELIVKELAEKYGINESRLLTKIDICVVLPFTILFFVAYLNRTNLGYARNAGIHDTLDVSSFSIVLGYMAFFAPYIVFEIFSNLLMKIIRPHFWISVTVLFYGVATFSTGFIHTYAQFVGLEFIHGLFQSGSETAIFYILSHYYTRFESQKRFSGFYSISCISGVAGVNISSALMRKMDMVHGYESWRWLFIIEGAITIGVSIFLFFSIPDFPEGASFLSDHETLFVVKKLEMLGSKSAYQLKAHHHEIIETIFDPFVAIPAIACFGVYYSAYTYAFFEPLLMVVLGLQQEDEYKVYVLPWVIGFIWINLNGYLSDKLRIRSPFIILNCLLVIVGGILMVCKDFVFGTIDSRTYWSCYCIVMGAYAATPLTVGWATMNVGGHLRKGITTAILVSVGNCGGLASVLAIYSTKRSSNFNDTFKIGLIPSVVLSGLTIIFTLVYCVLINKENNKKRTYEYKVKYRQLSEREKSLKGDKNPSFEYSY